jgi:hypothetical protein
MESESGNAGQYLPHTECCTVEISYNRYVCSLQCPAEFNYYNSKIANVKS